MSIWFTADTHFGHTNIIRYCERPFSSAQEMDDTLIKNWNDVVGPDDVIYHLGDFTLAGSGVARRYFSRLNGEIFIVPGSHDKRWLREKTFAAKSGHPIVILPPLYTVKLSPPNIEQPRLIVLCHYALRVWDRSHYGSWHLYGHSHGKLAPLKNSLDVGVDCWQYQPVALDTISQVFL